MFKHELETTSGQEWWTHNILQIRTCVCVSVCVGGGIFFHFMFSFKWKQLAEGCACSSRFKAHCELLFLRFWRLHAFSVAIEDITFGKLIKNYFLFNNLNPAKSKEFVTCFTVTLVKPRIWSHAVKFELRSCYLRIHAGFLKTKIIRHVCRNMHISLFDSAACWRLCVRVCRWDNCM